jgi:hypothetical protein
VIKSSSTLHSDVLERKKDNPVRTSPERTLKNILDTDNRASGDRSDSNSLAEGARRTSSLVHPFWDSGSAEEAEGGSFYGTKGFLKANNQSAIGVLSRR